MHFQERKVWVHEESLSDLRFERKETKAQRQKPKQQGSPLLCYKMEPSTMRNNFRIHAQDASRNILVFVTHFSISGDGLPPPIALIYFFYLLLTYLFTYLVAGFSCPAHCPTLVQRKIPRLRTCYCAPSIQEPFQPDI